MEFAGGGGYFFLSDSEIDLCVCVCLERFHELDKRCRELDVANNELKQLNAQLEKDLLSVGGVTALFRRGPEVCWIIFFRFVEIGFRLI